MELVMAGTYCLARYPLYATVFFANRPTGQIFKTHLISCRYFCCCPAFLFLGKKKIQILLSALYVIFDAWFNPPVFTYSSFFFRYHPLYYKNFFSCITELMKTICRKISLQLISRIWPYFCYLWKYIKNIKAETLI